MLSDEALKKHLKKWFGFNDFRSGQKEVIQSILDGKDTLGVLPTGTGKTLIYQYVGKMVDGMVIVVSPLISLMQDQVDRMRYLGEKQTVAITSNLSWVDRKRVIKNLNNYKYVYVSPEMLSNSDILDAFKQHKISLFVVDEAHCINQWGPDFRPEYLNLKDIIISLNHPTTLMLTATASNDVVLDIKEKIGLPNVETIKYSTNRPNIALAVDTFTSNEDKNNQLLYLVNKLMKPGIIYFSSKKVANAVCEWLKEKTNLNVEVYHADLDADSRYRIQHQFISDQIDIICATSAFGMGIDKDNIRFVIHYHMPANLESYVQEMGRAGRDGKQSISVILYKEKDEVLQYRFIDDTIPSEDMINFFYNHYQQLKNNELDEKADLINYYFQSGFTKNGVINIFEGRRNELVTSLNQMLGYVKTKGCKRAFLLRYFNENFSEHDENCCNGDGTQLQLEQMDLVQESKSLNSRSRNIKWQSIIQTLFSK